MSIRNIWRGVGREPHAGCPALSRKGKAGTGIVCFRCPALPSRWSGQSRAPKMKARLAEDGQAVAPGSGKRKTPLRLALLDTSPRGAGRGAGRSKIPKRQPPEEPDDSSGGDYPWWICQCGSCLITSDQLFEATEPSISTSSGVISMMVGSMLNCSN